MAEPEEEEDRFAGMSATSSTVRRKSEPPEPDPFAELAEPRATRKRRAVERDDAATVQEMPGFGVETDDPSAEGFTPGVSTLAHRKGDSLLRLELAARLPEPDEPAPGSRPGAIQPTVPLSPAQLRAAGASSGTAPKSGPRMSAAATAEPAPTVPESLSALGKTEERPADAAKRRRAFGGDKALPARTVQLMEAARTDETPGPVKAPKVAPRAVAAPRKADSGRASLPGGAWLAIGLGAGVAATLVVVWLSAAHDGYVELYRNYECAVFQYSPDKSGEGVEAKLARFRGTLTADAEHRFNGVYATGRVIESGCNAHGRRKFRDAEATQPLLAQEGGAFIAAMYVAEEQARTDGLVGDALLAHRRTHIRPIATELAKWLAAVEPTLLPSDLLTAAVGYYRKHWDALTRFIDDPEVPIDNSPTEREFQNFAKLRLNMLFAGSTEGAHRACVLLGIVATCRSIGVPVQAYLAWAFDRLGTHRDQFALPLEEITPAAFKAARG